MATEVRSIDPGSTGSGSEPTREELLARIAELESAKTTTQRETFKLTDKGGVSMYGFGRFPVTLYGGQWEALLTAATGLSIEDLRGYEAPLVLFMDENRDALSTLDGKKANKLQNTIVKVREEALVKLVREIRKTNPRISVAEAEAQAQAILGQ